VPGRTQLHDNPPEVTEITNGYRGDQHVLIQDKLVVADRNSHRVAANVSGVAD
jgi:hypothetical protein